MGVPLCKGLADVRSWLSGEDPGACLMVWFVYPINREHVMLTRWQTPSQMLYLEEAKDNHNKQVSSITCYKAIQLYSTWSAMKKQQRIQIRSHNKEAGLQWPSKALLRPNQRSTWLGLCFRKTMISWEWNGEWSSQNKSAWWNVGFSGLRPTCSPQEHGFSSLWTVQVTPITRAKANCREGSDEDGGEGGERRVPGFPFYHPASLVPSLLTYLDPQKVGHPPWEEPLWLQQLLGPPESVGPVGWGLGWGVWLSAPKLPGRLTWEPRVLFFALCGYLSNFRSQLKHHFSERLLGSH